MWKLFILLTVFILISCDRVEYFPDNPIIVNKTIVLAHKGGGSFDEGNTFEACKLGLDKLDGIECDIQRSSDNVLWLSHSYKVSSCDNFEGSCFASLNSSTIIQIDSCLGKEKNYTQLEKIFQLMSIYYPNKYISLDVKAWSPCSISGINITKAMNELAQEIINLTKRYRLDNRVMVESETGDFLHYIKTHSENIETYLTTLGDLELGISRALDSGFSGISFDYTHKNSVSKELIELMHRKGLKIQLWTLFGSNDIEEALLLKPDFIQTDYIEYQITKHY